MTDNECSSCILTGTAKQTHTRGHYPPLTLANTAHKPDKQKQEEHQECPYSAILPTQPPCQLHSPTLNPSLAFLVFLVFFFFFFLWFLLYGLKSSAAIFPNRPAPVDLESRVGMTQCAMWRTLCFFHVCCFVVVFFYLFIVLFSWLWHLSFFLSCNVNGSQYKSKQMARVASWERLCGLFYKKTSEWTLPLLQVILSFQELLNGYIGL